MLKTKNLVLCALFAAITCVLAPVSIPIGIVPVSLATFAVMLSGIVLGAKWGTLSQLIYLVIGAVGLPVFSSYSGGVSKLAGPTGGYLVGYLALSFICGFVYYHFGKGKSIFKKYAAMIISMIIGTAVLYAFGTFWFCLVTHTGFLAALATCVVPFLIGDGIKMVAVCIIAPQIEFALSKIHFSDSKKQKIN